MLWCPRGLTLAVLALSSLPVEYFHGHTRRRSRWRASTRRQLLASEGGRSEERIWGEGVESRQDAKCEVKCFTRVEMFVGLMSEERHAHMLTHRTLPNKHTYSMTSLHG